MCVYFYVYECIHTHTHTMYLYKISPVIKLATTEIKLADRSNEALENVLSQKTDTLYVQG